MDDFYQQQLKKWGEWWRGDFSSWEEAEKECIGYDQEIIVQKVFNTILTTKDRNDCYERDSCVIPGFPDYIYNYLDYLIDKVVVDFGGGLGSTYFPVSKKIKIKKWYVVEQDIFVKYGQNLEDGCLYFYNDIKKINDFDVILFSSSLSYIENYEKYIQYAIDYKTPYIIFDRHSVIQNSNQDRLTIQIVPACIYPTIYPCWFFGENKLKDFMTANNYILQKEHMSLGDTSATGSYVPNSAYKGYIYAKK